MNTTKWLSILLSISLGANFWFMWNQHQVTKKSKLQSNIISQQVPDSSHTSIKHPWMNNDSTESLNNNAQQSDGLLSFDSTELNSQEDFFAFLSALVKAKEYDTLEFEVSRYLRLYPNDMKALMLEAEAYYHTKPLNTALVHYHELLSKPLTNAQINEVEKIIAVNTTRVIQQFSGDGAWDLLAAFLEPLVQIDPLNRQYLLALARSYGMQQQFTLMEDVLAAFSADDPRAKRLRDNVLARLNQEDVDEALIDSLANIEDFNPAEGRSPIVVLPQWRGQFIAQARIYDTPVNLLVDTGASTTVVSDRVMETVLAKEIELLGKCAVNTAGGQIQAPIDKVKSMLIGPVTVSNATVLVLPVQNLSQFDCLH